MPWGVFDPVPLGPCPLLPDGLCHCHWPREACPQVLSGTVTPCWPCLPHGTPEPRVWNLCERREARRVPRAPGHGVRCWGTARADAVSPTAWGMTVCWTPPCTSPHAHAHALAPRGVGGGCSAVSRDGGPGAPHKLPSLPSWLCGDSVGPYACLPGSVLRFLHPP